MPFHRANQQLGLLLLLVILARYKIKREYVNLGKLHKIKREYVNLGKLLQATENNYTDI